MLLPEYDDLDALAMAQHVRDGSLSSAELLDAAIARIEARNPRLNAVVYTMFDRARARVSRLPDGPLRGVPFLVKDLKLQIAGYAFDVDEVLLRGDPASGKFAIFHLKGDLVQAVEAINSPPEFMMGKNLILSRKPVNKAKLADPAVSMKEVAA